jgi:hypothetical protein
LAVQALEELLSQKYLDMKYLQVVAVGDASKTREILSKYGTVQVFDTEGKPIAGSVENNSKSVSVITNRGPRDQISGLAEF